MHRKQSPAKPQRPTRHQLEYPDAGHTQTGRVSAKDTARDASSVTLTTLTSLQKRVVTRTPQ